MESHLALKILGQVKEQGGIHNLFQMGAYGLSQHVVDMGGFLQIIFLEEPGIQEKDDHQIDCHRREGYGGDNIFDSVTECLKHGFAPVLCTSQNLL